MLVVLSKATTYRGPVFQVQINSVPRTEAAASVNGWMDNISNSRMRIAQSNSELVYVM